MRTTMETNQESRQRELFCRYTELIRLCNPLLSTASLRVVGQEGHTPLQTNLELLETEGGTHAHPAASRRFHTEPEIDT